jgi:hypothetical protein
MPVRIVGTDLAGMDLARTAITASATISATTSATGTVAITVGPFTVINEGQYDVDFYTPSLVKGTTNIDMELWQDGAPGTGTMVATLSGHLTANATPFLTSVRISLSAGTHTLRVAGFVDAGSGTVTAGTGATTGTNPPAYCRVRPA